MRLTVIVVLIPIAPLICLLVTLASRIDAVGHDILKCGHAGSIVQREAAGDGNAGRAIIRGVTVRMDVRILPGCYDLVAGVVDCAIAIGNVGLGVAECLSNPRSILDGFI